MVNYHEVIMELGRYAQLGIFGLFVVGCYLIWNATHWMSKGHYIVGEITVLVQAGAWVLMAYGPERVTLFRIIVYGSLCLWIYYNVWHFNRFPVLKQYLENCEETDLLNGKPLYVPRWRLLRYLSEDFDQPRPFWFKHWFRWSWVGIVITLIAMYGFSRTINAYSWGYLKAANERKEAEAKTRTVVKSSVNNAVATTLQSTSAAIEQAVIPLRQGQQDLKQDIRANRQEARKTEATVKRDLRRATAEAGRPAPLNVTLPQPKASILPVSAPSLPDVKPPPVFRKGRNKYGYDYEDAAFDSAYYARKF